MINILLVLLVAGFRVFKTVVLTDPGWSNICPMVALAFGGSLILGKRVALWLPIASMGLSDILIAMWSPWPFDFAERAGIYGILILASMHGNLLRGSGRTVGLYGTQIAWTLVFYVVSNSLCWAGGMGYQLSFLGWAQALTVGLPGFEPTWMFLVRSLGSDLALFIIFTEVYYGLESRKPLRIGGHGQ